MRGRPQNTLANILRRIHVCEITGCWFWTGSRNSQGYGYTRYGKRMRRVHGVIYEALIGMVPGGLQLDHLCNRTSCCAPFHLKPTTARENTLRGNAVSAINARKTACIRGHLFNDYRHAAGYRRCKECLKIENASRKAYKAAWSKKKYANYN